MLKIVRQNFTENKTLITWRQIIQQILTRKNSKTKCFLLVFHRQQSLD